MKAKFAAVAAAIVFASGIACALAWADSATPSAATVQATRQMMDAMHARDMMLMTLQAMEQTMPAQMRGSVAASLERNTAMTPQQKAEALARFDRSAPEMNARMHALFADPTLVDDMLSAMVPLYASTYTVDELNQLTTFYKSPVGQKMIATTPKLMGQIMQISSQIVQPRIAKVLADGAPAKGQ